VISKDDVDSDSPQRSPRSPTSVMASRIVRPSAPPTLHHSSGRFRPDLEGLRAVAVVLVLLYHANVPGFGGGYVGVDVFFVLSGFLITGLIYRELSSTGRFSLVNFYARRARRLLPAAGFVLIATLIAAVVVLPAYRLPAIQADIASAGLYVSNMRFGVEANDYFAATADPSPVLHFWSLSVEEQFYILWPTILIGLYAGLPGIASPQRRIAVGIVVLGLLSLGAAIWLTSVNQPWAFFLLPTRAWELAVGGFIAVALGRLGGLPARLAASCTVVGLAFVITSALLFSDATPFPGLAAILPVAGAALVILGGLPAEPPLPARLLAIGPLRFLGRISYSVYLWHWPILILGAAILGPTMTIPLALLSIPVAAASQRWIEEPLRHGRIIGIRPGRNLLQAAGVGLAVVITSVAVSAIPTGVTTAATNIGATPSPLSNVGPRTCSGCTMADLTPTLDDLAVGRIADGVCDPEDAAECILGSTKPSAPTVALFGDSHAGTWTAVLARLAATRGWRLVHLTYGGCPSLMTPVWSIKLKRVFNECDAWQGLALARLEAEQPDLIILANAEHYYLADRSGGQVAYTNPPTASWMQLWSGGLDRMLLRLTSLGSDVAVIGDVPVPSWSGLDPTACIERQRAGFEACRAQRSTALPPQVHDLEKSIAASHGVTFVDPSPWLCDAATCPAVIEHYVVYLDGSGHLTTPFVMSLADRLLSALPFPASGR
jgi:peptidoglycan/LPS O-acetylase OafA/YrhL